MGLYLCVFADDESDVDLEGVEVGGYDDFDSFRELVAVHVEQGVWGSQCPTLMNHVDSSGTWTVEECVRLRSELVQIADVLARVPAPGYTRGTWQQSTAKALGIEPVTLRDWVFDVDGEPLVHRLIELVDCALAAHRPIHFM